MVSSKGPFFLFLFYFLDPSHTCGLPQIFFILAQPLTPLPPSINRSPRGIVLVIPREPINGKPSCRFDIQIENKSRVEATQEDAVRMIKAIFHPFSVEWDEVSWWSSYDGEWDSVNLGISIDE